MSVEQKPQPLSGGQYLTNRIAELEGAVATLIDQRAALARECDELRLKVAELDKENAELKAAKQPADVQIQTAPDMTFKPNGDPA